MATWSRYMADRRFLPWLEWVFSLLLSIPRILQKLELTEAECTLIVPLWITQPWYTKLLHLLIDTPVLLPKRKNLVSKPLTGKAHPTLYKTRFLACRLSGKFCKNSGIPSKTADIVLSAWRSGTSKACNTYVKRWLLYCRQRGQNPLQPTVIAVLQLLTLLYEEGKGYSSLNMSRCAISTLSLEKDTVGSHHLISKFLRGVFSRHPTLPRNNVTWDADVVLNFLKTWAPAKRLSLRQLTLKLRCSSRFSQARVDKLFRY